MNGEEREIKNVLPSETVTVEEINRKKKKKNPIHDSRRQNQKRKRRLSSLQF